MPYAYFYGRVSHENSANKKSDTFIDRCASMDVQLRMAQQRLAYDQALDHPDLIWGTAGWVGKKREGTDQTDGCFVDQVVSAYKTDWLSRPAGGRCWAQLKRGDTLYTAYLDRMFRRNRDQAITLGMFKDRGVRIVFINENLDSTNEYHQFMIQIMSSVSELSSLTTSRRIREAHAFKRANGQYPHRNTPRGFKKDRQTKRVVPNDETRRLRLRLINLRDEQSLTFREISDLLEQERVAREGGPLLPEYAGDRLEARPWAAKRLKRLYEDQTVPLPGDMLPPGTFDAPPGTPPRDERVGE